jgi:branched-chain amino acid transport system substrate-binding protein
MTRSLSSLRAALPTLALATLTAGAALPAQAAPIKVGIALDLSGAFAVPGAEARDGFTLALQQLGGKLGGQPAEFLMTDMGGSPDQAKQLVDRFVQRDKIDFFTGPIASNVTLAVAPSLAAAKVPYLSANAGPSQLAGAQCNPYFFGTAYQNDQFHEAAGQFAQERNFAKVYILSVNTPGGKDGITGFKRRYKGQVVDEVYTKLGQIDYANELAALRAAKPQALYFFLPGSMGVNFVRQFVAAGLSKDITLVSSGFSADEDIIPGVGEPMLGLFNTAHWAHDLDNAPNKAFVAAFRKAYNRYPSLYAAQAYDAVLAMNAAVRDVKGKVDDRAAVVAALAKANYASIRGPFSYGKNHFPVENFYLRMISRTPDGVITNRTLKPVFEKYADAYAAQCPMK